MQDEIGVNTDTLRSQVESLRTEIGQAENELGKMYDAVQALDGMWDGPANEAFKAQFMDDREFMEELCKTVREIIDSMDNARTEYESCENAVRQMIEEIRI
ncbi:MAG: WXG100 family type VII secretion target [Lachnospiraceae bacterium]|nr:WXG100 family type VII secretion target [Lachnospiraceae bacterium]